MAESNSASTPAVNTEIESGRFDEKDIKPTTEPIKKKTEDDDEEEEDIVSARRLLPTASRPLPRQASSSMLVAPC